MPSSVRPAAAEDAAAIGAVLGTAFDGDPIMQWVFPDRTRLRRLTAMFQYLARHRYVERGACTMTPGDEAGALWLPPGGDHDSDEFWAAHGEPFAVALEGEVERLIVLSTAMAETHPSDAHWYLVAIGALPAGQGRGLGSALLAHTLAVADERAEPAYLEATSPRSRVLYERFGFEVMDERRPAGGPPFWPMWRPPV